MRRTNHDQQSPLQLSWVFVHLASVAEPVMNPDLTLKLHESTLCVTKQGIHKLVPACIISIHLQMCCRRLIMSCSTGLWHPVDLDSRGKYMHRERDR